MKKFIFTFGLLLGLLFSAFSQNDYIKLDSKDIPETTLQEMTQLVEKIMDGQKSGNYYILSDAEASSEMVKAFTITIQKESYQYLQQQFGDYSSLKFSEAWGFGSNVIYRFRGTFKGTDQQPEIRVVLNDAGKLGGFWIKPWKENMQDTF